MNLNVRDVRDDHNIYWSCQRIQNLPSLKLSETNIAPENGWLEDDRLFFGMAHFQGRTVSFREGTLIFQFRYLVHQPSQASQPIYQVTRPNSTPWFQIYRELEDEAYFSCKLKRRLSGFVEKLIPPKLLCGKASFFRGHFVPLVSNEYGIHGKLPSIL